jgi:hypothetical protein
MHGAVVALRLRGRGGLFYIDGPAGFYDGSGGHSGEIADMGLAIATGHNHPLMSNIEGLSPYVQPGDAVAWGLREEAEAALYGPPSPRGSGIQLFDLKRLRIEGTDRCLAEAIAAVRGTGRMAGLSVSIFNPRKDHDGRSAMALADCVAAGLRGVTQGDVVVVGAGAAGIAAARIGCTRLAKTRCGTRLIGSAIAMAPP